MKTGIDKPKRDTESGGGKTSDRNVSEKRNYTPYIIGVVVLLAVLIAAIIF